MAGEQEVIQPAPKFRLSNYREVTYQHNGQITDPLLSEQAIKIWEDSNRSFQGKAWGAGQALFFERQPLTFGRNDDIVDVKFDADPDKDGYATLELGISRRHFELQPPQNNLVKITDLGSTNGCKVFTKEGNIKANLKGVGATTLMEIGDFMLTGGGEVPEKGGRQIGFRVCKDPNTDEIFLVKFNQRTLADLVMLAGMNISPEKLRRIEQKTAAKDSGKPVERDPRETEALQQAYQKSFEKMRRLREERAQDPDTMEALEALTDAFSGLTAEIRNLAQQHFNNDWKAAAFQLGDYASQITKQARDNGEIDKMLTSGDIMLFCNDLASGLIMPQTIDQPPSS